MSGRLIVIEGLDGSGKSTQFEMLKNCGDFSDFRFITFPNYESLPGQIITEYLSGKIEENDQKISSYSASSFYAIDRYISYKRDWGKAYLAGEDVITARYVTSNAIYQMAKLEQESWGEFCSWLYDYEYKKLGLPQENAVIYLDLPLAKRQELLEKRYDGEESRFDMHESNCIFMQKCDKAAHFLAERDGWIVVDCLDENGIRKQEDIFCEICRIVKEIG